MNIEVLDRKVEVETTTNIKIELFDKIYWMSFDGDVKPTTQDLIKYIKDEVVELRRFNNPENFDLLLYRRGSQPGYISGWISVPLNPQLTKYLNEIGYLNDHVGEILDFIFTKMRK